MCEYVMHRFSTISKGMFELDSRKGGRNRFGNHMKRDPNSNAGNIAFNSNFLQKCAKEIAEGAAYALALDLRPMIFAERSHGGMSKLLTSVFKAGKSVPLDVNIDQNLNAILKGSNDFIREVSVVVAARIPR